MKVTLLVNGRDKQANTEQIVEKPAEGKWFKVIPLSIDQQLFKKERGNSKQEETRKLSLEAFTEMKKNPKYAKPFKTMMPVRKIWERKTVGELKELASKLGDHNADWVEQALEWAQRIANGETWKAVCNEPDTANWYRLVVWKNGYCRLVGGSRKDSVNVPASVVSSDDYYYYCDTFSIYYTVPLVVLYE